jgi:hypothetical protein
MPTLNWIQESASDRFWELGSDPGLVSVKTHYACRVCNQSFDSIAARDRHEISHPIQNPTIFFKGKEVGGDTLDITSPIECGDVYLRNIDFLCVNGEDCQSESNFVEILSKEKRAFYQVRYGSDSLERRLRINVCIADPDELCAVDIAFIQCFAVAGVKDISIVAFSEKVKKLNSVVDYGDGLVRYLQGLMAKDNQSATSSFDMFAERFNQATYSLRNYDTRLTRAVSAIVNFNRNDFSKIAPSGIPDLDNAVNFFLGGEIMSSTEKIEANLLPVDFVTEFILTRILPMYEHGLLAELQEEIKSISPELLSLQDKSKFDFICWRKAIKQGDIESGRNYQRRLKMDNAFSCIVENAK